jgi:predicted O-methyltransferase YrrM
MQNFLAQSVAEINENLRGKAYRLEQGRPYMKRREQEIFEEVMIRLQPRKCLELGAGFSTLHFPKLLPEGGRWISVENNRAWYSRIRDQSKHPGVDLKWIKMSSHPVAETDQGLQNDMQAYLQTGFDEAPLDLILIDGRQRMMCMQQSLDMIADDGIIVLHDANRKFYQRNVPGFRHQVLFTDFRRNAGGIWLGSPSKPIEEVLEVRKHRKKWRLLQNKFAKILNI